MSKYHVGQKLYYGLDEFSIEKINLEDDIMAICRVKDAHKGNKFTLSISQINLWYRTNPQDAASERLDRLIEHAEAFVRDFVKDTREIIRVLRSPNV